jgi:hypothetical protein
MNTVWRALPSNRPTDKDGGGETARRVRRFRLSRLSAALVFYGFLNAFSATTNLNDVGEVHA